MMDLDLVISIIEENGYVGLLFWMWFGVFFVPVPNEVMLMTVGLASSMGSLHPVPAFAVSYMGLVMALTTSYLIGRLVGRRFLEFLKQRKRFGHSIESSLKLMDKYHAFSLSLSCFIPGARHFVPLLYGLSRLSWKTFAFFAYSGAFIWVLIIFLLGYLFGDKMEIIVKYRNELWVVFFISVAFVMSFLLMRRSRRKKHALEGEGLLMQERRPE